MSLSGAVVAWLVLTAPVERECLSLDKLKISDSLSVGCATLVGSEGTTK